MNLVLVPKCYSYNELFVDTFTLVLGPCGNELLGKSFVFRLIGTSLFQTN